MTSTSSIPLSPHAALQFLQHAFRMPAWWPELAPRRSPHNHHTKYAISGKTSDAVDSDSRATPEGLCFTKWPSASSRKCTAIEFTASLKASHRHQRVEKECELLRQGFSLSPGVFQFTCQGSKVRALGFI